MSMRIYSIGHSTRTFEQFLNVLKHYKIELLVDLRKLPGSNKFPHFNKENLEKELPKNGIEYLHFPELGGFRKGGYEAFTKTQVFYDAIKKLIEIIDDKTVAIMCAEWNVLGCHRWYVSQTLSELGNEVIHLIDIENFKLHEELPKKMKRMICERKTN